MSTSAIELTGYSLVQISGPERSDFLQGQLTQDLGEITNQQSALAGWASVKGRLLMIAPLLAWQESYYLPVPTDISDALTRRLRMFVLRANVTVELADCAVVGLLGLEADKQQNIGGLNLNGEPGSTASNDEICVARVIGDPSRAWLIGDAQKTATIVESETTKPSEVNAWDLCNVKSGLPVISGAVSESFIPQMVNLDLLGGISFTKGCYLGQEIVARTQNLGRIKRRMYRFGAESTLNASPGTNVYGPENISGTIVATANGESGTELLAVVPIKDSAAQWFGDEGGTQPLKQLELPYSIPE